MKTGVIIIGAGPSGLMLGHILHQAGVDCLVLERRSPEYVLSRIRAGVLERGTINIMEQLNLADRLFKEGIPHDGLVMAYEGGQIEIDVAGLAGEHVMVYGQTEITKDLMQASENRGLPVIYEADNVSLYNIDSEAPYVTYEKEGREHKITGRFIAGCDGYHGPSRQAVPKPVGSFVEKEYPFGWLGILADVPPCYHNVIYANHPHGFALASMRSNTRSRYYVQVPQGEQVDEWSDERFWDELELRLGPELSEGVTRGPSIEKSIAPLRSYIFEPMRHKSLFLAGDAAHIVPPTGAKGLNLAASDIAYLGPALIRFFKDNDSSAIDGYAQKALTRVWKSSRFSWYLTSLMHRFPDTGEFGQKMQEAELNYIAHSKAAQTMIAENYIGLPL